MAPPIGKPKITDAETDRVAGLYFPDGEPNVLVIGVRGYFEDVIGKPNENDVNVYDDAFLVRERGQLIATFNANVDPTKLSSNQAQLLPGVYQFYRGKHKQRIAAFRAYPEGVKLPCRRQRRNGEWYPAYCSFINIHDGGLYDTWSFGCQTAPGASAAKVWGNQFGAFRDLVYRLMDGNELEMGVVNNAPVKLLTYLLIDEDAMVEALAQSSQIAPVTTTNG